MDETLAPIYEKIMGAVSAEEVFGVVDIVLPPEDLLRYLHIEYDNLYGVVDPNLWSHPDDHEMAVDANERLKHFYEKAQERIKEGVYGLGGLINPRIKSFPSFETSKRRYFIGPEIAQGDISIVYQGFCEVGDESVGEVIIKVVDDPVNNDLAENEIRILEVLHADTAPQWKHLPFLLDTFETDGKTGIVLRRLNGHNLLEVRDNSLYQEGVDRKHMVWMLNRLLSAIGYVHSQGVVHGNLEPSHLMILPQSHNLYILDWSYAALMPEQTGDDFKGYTEIYSPPEVLKKESPIPSSDIYSIGKVMIWLLGGNPETNEMPDCVEEELQRFLKGFVLESKYQRPNDAWQLHAQLISIVEGLWGPRKFLEFVMD